MEWMILPFKRYADFSGRSRRKEYWMFQLFNLLVILLFFFLFVATARAAGDTGSTGEAGPLEIVLISAVCLYLVAALIPALAVEVRRFHDQGKSGWNFLWRFFPGIGGLIILFFMVQNGSGGENAYGPDPKEDSTAGIFD